MALGKASFTRPSIAIASLFEGLGGSLGTRGAAGACCFLLPPLELLYRLSGKSGNLSFHALRICRSLVIPKITPKKTSIYLSDTMPLTQHWTNLIEVKYNSRIIILA
jgi:hypothetical protein